ncbi:MAG: hypothetical protein IKK47_05850 [Ruminococcus sp.]|nr:hypothetical protein [Ruminococcus sp.]
MKPLSPLYFIKQNKTRCILLMFMIFLSFGAYLGGLYIYTPQENWDYACSLNDKFIEVYMGYNDENAKNYNAFRDEMKKRDDVIVIETGWYNQIERKTIMGFTDGSLCSTFRTVDDFKTFCEQLDIKCNFDNVKEHTVVLSRLMADTKGYKVGDVISPDDDENDFYYDFTIAGITNEPGYTQYYIGSEEENGYEMIILGKGISKEEVLKHAQTLAEKYPVHIEIPLREDIYDTYCIFNTIFIIVVIFLALILSVTVNAVFVGMYQRREFEFAVYRAIGISKKQIIKKICGEILCMDAIVLTLGGIIFFIGLYLFNHLVLFPNGLYIVYYAPVAIIALILCNVMTVVPLIITRTRKLLKTNVCDY